MYKTYCEVFLGTEILGPVCANSGIGCNSQYLGGGRISKVKESAIFSVLKNTTTGCQSEPFCFFNHFPEAENYVHYFEMVSFLTYTGIGRMSQCLYKIQKTVFQFPLDTGYQGGNDLGLLLGTQ